ncbi:MAG: hypothetical protein GIW99_06730 [Candidatus Eremiobacteraeota bacterium]|nr:hypothetical protein [Candidatus Eremiobacteraeota bacterium]MBC5827362.1 hypothetical protein [Candidatus Eremiobacteraeota bacterium]
MLATLVDGPFDDADWIFEIKWDGVRAVCTIRDDRRIALVSRNGLDLLGPFPEFGDLPGCFKKLPIVVDGEIVSLDTEGRSSFQRLQQRLNRLHFEGRASESDRIVYVAFDMLYGDGRSLTDERLLERKRRLNDNLRKNRPLVMYSEHSAGSGRALYRAAQEHSLEGIVGKRSDSPYRQGRSKDWVKIKVQLRQEFVIGGWTEPRGTRKLFGALLLGLYEGERLVYVGHVGTGFGDATLREIMGRLQRLNSDRCPFAKKPRSNSSSHWVRPKLVAEVKFGEWTRDGILRQPVFLGLRTDKPAFQCAREPPLPAATRP